MTTDTSEKGLETLIVQHMTDTKGLDVQPHQAVEYQALHGAVRTHETREAAERLPDEGPIDRNDDDVHVELES